MIHRRPVGITGGGLALLLGLLLPFSSTLGQQAAPIPSSASTVAGDASGGTGASQLRTITLDEAIALALGRSFDFYAYGQNLVENAYRLAEARSGAGFQMRLSGQLPRYTQDLQVVDWTNLNGGDIVSAYAGVTQTRLSSSLELGRQLPTGGAIVLRASMLAVDQNSELLSDEQQRDPGPVRLVHPRLGVRFRQPLFAFNETRARIRMAEMGLERARLGYSEEELREISRITAAFYQLLRGQELLRVSRDMEAETARVAEIGERRFAVGLIAEVDRYALQLTHSQAASRRLEVEQSLEARRLELARRMGLSLEAGIEADRDTEFRPVFADPGVAVGRALESRSDHRRAELGVEEALLDLERVRDEGRPKLALNVSYDLGGISTFTAGPDESWTRHLDAAFLPDSRFAFSAVTLSVEFPLIDSGLHNSTLMREQTRLETARRWSEEVETELAFAVRRLCTLVNTLSSLGEEYAQNRLRGREYYAIASRLFEAGEVGSTDLLLALQRRIEAEESYLDALVEFETSKALLRELTLWDWDTNQPVELRSRMPTIAR